MKTRIEVITELQSIVKTDRNKWSDDAFDRAIDTALRAFADARPLTGTASLQLEIGCRQYQAPECMIDYLGSEWGAYPQLNTWDATYPGPLPRVFVANSLALGRVIEFGSTPTARHIAVYGSEFNYYYKSRHVLSEEDNSIRADDHDLFITRCLAALVQDLMVRGVVTPIQMNKSMGSVPTSATPAKVLESLMAIYRQGV